MMSQAGAVLCFGEMLLRLSAPGKSHLLQEARFDAHVGGAEANVAVALARIGVRSALVTILPDDALGDAALEAVRGAGVDVSGVLRGSGAPRSLLSDAWCRAACGRDHLRPAGQPVRAHAGRGL